MQLVEYHKQKQFFLLAGPCAIENESIAMQTAEYLKGITEKLDIPFVFKGSYRKANRTSLSSFSGIGDEKALKILDKVRKELDCFVVTDIHESAEAAMAAEYVDVLQIPAFLFRQTDLLVAAAKTGKVVNIKKGQFAAANAMEHAVKKVKESGNELVWQTERGNMFGYGDMVVDYRNIPELQSFGAPTIMDITHSVQQPNNGSGVTGGRPDMIETIAKAAVAVGVDGLFLETHPSPNEAKSDGANMLPLNQVEELLLKLIRIREAIR